MGTTPDVLYAKQFGDVVLLKAQQMGSRLRGSVTIKAGVRGEDAYMEQVGATAALDITGRFQPTTITEQPHYRRRVSLIGSYVNPGLDPNDEVRMIVDPTSAYVRNAVAAMGRKIDDRIIAAATATAYTGKDGSTAVTLPSSQIVAAGGQRMTLAKWLSAIEILNAADTDPDDQRWIVISAKQLTDLLNTTEIKNSQYAAIKALVQGEVNSFLGCNVIRSQRLGNAGAGSTRQVLLYCQTGIGLAIGQDVISRIDVRPDLNYTKQIYFKMQIGATRLEEEKVVEIDCSEA